MEVDHNIYMFICCANYLLKKKIDFLDEWKRLVIDRKVRATKRGLSVD